VSDAPHDVPRTLHLVRRRPQLILLLILPWATGSLSCTKPNPEWCESDGDCQRAVRAGEIPQSNQRCVQYACRPGFPLADAGPGGDGSQADGGSDSDGQVGRDGGDDDGSANDGAPTPDSGLALGQTCTGDGSKCASSNCLDGVCCKTDTCGLCQACNVDGQEGQCAPKRDDSAPDAECLNETSGCQGRCDGAGACAYDTSEVCANDDSGCQGTCNNEGGCTFDTSQICKEECGGEEQGEGPVLIYTCETDGTCGEEPTPEDCAYSVCVENPEERTASCPGDCSTHDDCINGSLCDRTELQLDASGRPRGQCIEPSRVVAVTTTSAELAETVSNAPTTPGSGPLSVVRVRTSTDTGGVYDEKLELPSNGRLLLIGDPDGGPVTINVNSGPAIRVNAGGELAIQGFTIELTGGGESGIGILCGQPTGNRADLTVVQTTVARGTGIGIVANRCNLTLRRSTVDDNDGGGLSLASGNFEITSSLIINNGSASSDLGGVAFGTGSNGTFVNNTVAANRASSGKAGGVICDPAVTLLNSILADNGGTKASAGCPADDGTNVSAATLAAACGLDGNFKPTTGRCINDGGDNDAVTNNNLVADREGEPRIKSGKVDIGAFEVQ
jgi:hypothetical protein